ncbi:MAG: T9SS type A sorting domain-containing protein [Bacteroidota bacterium]
MRQKLIIYTVIFSICLLLPIILSARNAPVTTAGSSTICPGAAVTVPITVTGFTTIKAVTLRLDYDPTQLTFVSYTNLYPSFASASVNYINVGPTLTKIMIVWADVTALSLPNGTKLMDLNFTHLTGSPIVIFNNTSNSGGDCEYADENGASMNDVPSSTYYFNATITNNTVAPAGTITGANTLCAGASNVAYSVPAIANATSYIWTVPTGGSIVSGNNTQAIVVNYATSAVSGNVTVKGTNVCGQGATSSLTVTINPVPVPTITGLGTVCSGSVNVNYTTEPGMTGYTWTISPGGTITSGTTTNSVMVNWNTAGAQTLTVNYSISATGCSAVTPTSKTVTVNASPVPTITGTTTACAGSTGNVYTTEPGMTGYLWNISAGGSLTAGGGITDNSATINWNTAGAQTVSLNYTNSAGCAGLTATIKSVMVNALPLPTITGPLSVCAGSSGNVYTTEAAMTGYVWMVSAGGSVTAGGGPTNNTVTIWWNIALPQSVSVNYNNPAGCMAQNPAGANVAVNPLPVPTITGSASVCAGTTGVSYTTEAGMTNYLWTITPGGTITSGSGTNNIMVTWNTAGAQVLTVNYTASNGCAAMAPVSKTVTVTSIPGVAGIITGNSNVCAGDNGVPYSTPAITGATSYSWSLPAGAIIATGAGTNSITVNFGASAVAGNITVSGINTCGAGTSSPPLPVIISQMPGAAGTITGSDVVCAGTNGVIYSVPAIANATTYEWTLPAAAVITSGAGTNQIMVSFSATPGTGTFTVKGASVCGNGAVSPDFNVTMIASQGAPVVTAAGPMLTSSTATGNQWYYEGTGAITGATGQTYTATITGWYWTSVNGVGCPSLESNHVYVLFTGADEFQNDHFKVYPVPCNGMFNASITSSSLESYTIVVYNLMGIKIFEHRDIPVAGTFEQQIDLRPLAKGIYSVVIIGSDHTAVRKVIVR